MSHHSLIKKIANLESFKYSKNDPSMNKEFWIQKLESTIIAKKFSAKESQEWLESLLESSKNSVSSLLKEEKIKQVELDIKYELDFLMENGM